MVRFEVAYHGQRPVQVNVFGPYGLTQHLALLCIVIIQQH